MSNAIEKKSFDVVNSSIMHIGNFARQALLERTYENKISLDEVIQEIHDSNIDGFLDISIYERQKEENINKYIYLLGFEKYDSIKYLEDTQLIEELDKIQVETIFHKEKLFVDKQGDMIDTYQFVRPIFYTFQNQKVLLGIVVLHYDEEAISGVIKYLINMAIAITCVFILITIAIVYYAGSKFSRPILEIANAADNVAKGNLDIIDLQINTNDEIGILADHFNKMVSGLQEGKKMEKFVSDSTISMIQEDSKSQLVLGGKYQTLTFLFSDIRGFTALSETKKPEEVVNIINFYLHLQSEIIKKNGGDIDKFVGDEIMASFSGETAVLDATKCALEIQHQIIKHNDEREKIGKTICHVGIGINKGEVIVGNIGSKDRMDFTSIGSAVNLASRLCAYAQADEILIENETMKELEGQFITAQKEPVMAKGFSNPILVSAILLENNA